MSYNSARKDIKFDSSDKDILISQLKAQLFELEQNQKNYNNLNQKFRSIQNEFNILNEEKIKLEYETKQKLETNSKTISSLRLDLESINDSYNEKMIINKRLFDRVEKLEKQLETSQREKDDLSEKHEELIGNFKNLNEENRTNQLNNNELREIRQRNQFQIEKLSDENLRLKRNLDEKEKVIKNLENERIKLITRIEDYGFENDNLNTKLKGKEDNLLIVNKQLDETRQTVNQLQSKERELNLQNDSLKNDVEKLRFNLSRESKANGDNELTIQELERILRDRDAEIKRQYDELNTFKTTVENLEEDNNKLFSELEKMKNHILVLTEQNQKYCEELDIFVDQDEKLKAQLNKRERVNLIKSSNNFYLEKSLSNLDVNRGDSKGFNSSESRGFKSSNSFAPKGTV